MSNTEPCITASNRASLGGFFEEARRLSLLAVSRAIACLPVFERIGTGDIRIVGIGGALFDCPQTENDPARS